MKESCGMILLRAQYLTPNHYPRGDLSILYHTQGCQETWIGFSLIVQVVRFIKQFKSIKIHFYQKVSSIYSQMEWDLNGFPGLTCFIPLLGFTGFPEWK